MLIELPEELVKSIQEDTLTLVYRVISSMNYDTDIIPRLDRVLDLPRDQRAAQLQSILDDLEKPPEASTDEDDRVL
jgi:hypothetical protein